MDGRAPKISTSDDPKFPFIDFNIPTAIQLRSARMRLPDALDIIRAKGLAPWDMGTFLEGGPLGFDLATETAGITLLSASGCGYGATPRYTSADTVAGNPGGAGSNGAPGGGGGGAVEGYQGVNYSAGGGGRATPYGGGGGGGRTWRGGTTQGGGGTSVYSATPAPGVGPGYAFPGGKLTIICYGDWTINAGGLISVDGGAAANYGGASGAGAFFGILGGAFVNNGTIRAKGGANDGYGGPGDAGGITLKTFAQMGWA